MKPTVLLIIPNLGRGGAQGVFKDQLHYYSGECNAVGCVFNWDDSFEADRKLNIVSLDIPAGRTLFTKLFYFWRRIYRLRVLKRKLAIDISISHLEGADYVNILSRKKEKIITWIHGTKQFDENISGALGLFRKKILIPILYKKSDLIVTVSQGIKEELIHYFNLSGEKITTVINGVSINDILLSSEREIPPDFLSLASNHLIAITHCRLAKQKNLIALLRIMALIPKNANLKLVILGDGELRDSLLDQCSELKLSSFSVWNNDPWSENFDVYFLGHQHNPYPFLKFSSLYITTSLWEGFPLSLCEALTLGLPIIATDCHTGPREILCPELSLEEPLTAPYFSSYGILMPILRSEHQFECWAKTILKIMNDTDLRSTLSASVVERAGVFDKIKIEAQWAKMLSR